MPERVAPNAGAITLDLTHPLFQEPPWPWREIPAYRQSSRGNNQSATRVFDVPWGLKDWWEAVARGWTTYLTPAPGGIPSPTQGDNSAQLLIQRNNPWQHPLKPWLYCTGTELIGYEGTPGIDPGENEQSIIYIYNMLGRGLPNAFMPGDPNYKPGAGAIPPDGYARIAATFEAVDWDIVDDGQLASIGTNFLSDSLELKRNVSRFQGYAVENVRVAGQTLTFSTTQTKIDDFAYRIYATKTYTYVWRGVPAIPRAGILSCIGKVNQNKFDGNYEALLAGTAMCLAPEVSRYRGMDGRKLFDVSFKFAWRPDGWNNFFNPATGAFDPVTYTQNNLPPLPPNPSQGKPPFASANFFNLFTLWQSDLDGLD